ncbi:MAG: hypothetical protein HOM34_06725 [Planctomycetes bacterium]|jgi:hypothetical protein|nr:hypothetical protein [Planctomycetota bacterium]MBT4029841.1 hypothetical protein [Planctomycetota bacterium]MBT4559935.1 hypothetical protein [Planctomycetota bacterium]MBT5100796.1 hypothetical protein [Planctomycetota bacterium]MBT5120397.1 hypothetical protein [Planctomycetota bacterium]
MNSTKRDFSLGSWLAFFVLTLTPSCTVFTASTAASPPSLEIGGLVSAVVTVNGIRPYGNQVVRATMFDDEEPSGFGSLASLDVWPLGGVGFSVAGFRLKVLVFEIGVGTLGYSPQPADYWGSAADE